MEVCEGTELTGFKIGQMNKILSRYQARPRQFNLRENIMQIWPIKHLFEDIEVYQIHNAAYIIYRCKACGETLSLDSWQLKNMPYSMATCNHKLYKRQKMTVWEILKSSVNCLWDSRPFFSISQINEE
jgi:hypothetical protein